MRGIVVFVVFFTIFLVSSIAIPSPLFPGNVICSLIGLSGMQYTFLVGAFANGLVYGFAAWTIFYLVFGWVERAQSSDSVAEKEEQDSTS